MGKTTTKEMTAAALSTRGRVIRTSGNLNNEYGLPLSVMKMASDGKHASDFDFAVFEMGMNHKGELARLVQIAPPAIGVITNVAPVHLEFFDSVDQIAEAKSELLTGIKPGGAAVLNADDERVSRMRHLRSDIVIRSFGVDQPADVMARKIEANGLAGFSFELVTKRGTVNAKLGVGGRHNLHNALAAAAVADLCDTPLEQIGRSLTEFTGQKMRGEIISFKEGFTLIDDSYNSNPIALTEMVSTLRSVTGFKRRIVVCGEMLELGDAGPRLHEEVGEKIAKTGIDLLIGIRGLARNLVDGARRAGMECESAIFCETSDQAADQLGSVIGAGDLILVKGSRGVKTEVVVERVKQLFEPAEGKTEKRVS
jgi:UDP-N-acetylmuramoyl-tripeptide--D-alanyl-D-alanine ligase